MSTHFVLLLAFCGFIALMLFLGALPKIIARISDPPRMKRIQRYLESVGCTDIQIKPWPNHYGVHFTMDGKKLYAKCRVDVKADKIVWVGKPPVELDGAQTI
jgi:hypothetical protein